VGRGAVKQGQMGLAGCCVKAAGKQVTCGSVSWWKQVTYGSVSWWRRRLGYPSCPLAREPRPHAHGIERLGFRFRVKGLARTALRGHGRPPGQVPGRVGDAAVPGAGAYADSEVGGCGATGDGDIHLRFMPCYQVHKGYSWSYLVCRIGYLVPICQPIIGSSFQ
jgi:Asparaginase